MSEHLDMYKFWFKHWSDIDFASDISAEEPWEDLVEEYGEDKIKYAVKKDWISLYNSCGGIITDLPPEFDEEDEEAYVEMVVNGENMAQESAMLKGETWYKPDLESVNDLYGTPYDDCDDTETDEDSEEEVQTPSESEHLDMYKFWFKHWSSIDFANDLFDEQTKEDMFKEYGEEKIMYAAKKEWVTFHYDDWYGQIHNIAKFESGADETGIVEMRFNAKTLAQASEMLKGDKTYESDLKRINELYVQTPKRKRVELECPPAPKRAKV